LGIEEKKMPDLSNIKHIVVLMLENRSFDNVFGYLRPWAANQFEGLDGNPSPNLDNNGIAPWTTKPNTDCSRMPNPDPGEGFADIKTQIFGDGATPTMSGFTANYAANQGQAEDIMHCFPRSELPALSTLADHYAVSDMWFASAPCQTWPNRFFVHTGTADGYENNTMDGAPYLMQTIFNDLPDNASWNIYFHDMPQAMLLTRLWSHLANFQFMDKFYQDAAAGNLPSYSFIEPQYYPIPAIPPTDVRLPNDMHPPHIVQLGDALVAQVYNAVRASPNWNNTLLIVTFDEHGGCYDHVPPPSAVPPGPPRQGHFKFDSYGVRVPALIISPYTQPATVLRAPAGGPPFDHTSIIRTVRKCFGIASPLSAREASAPDVSAALNAPFDPNHLPLALPVPTPVISDADKQLAQSLEPNDLQTALHTFVTTIDALSTGSSIEELLTKLANRSVTVQSNAKLTPPPAKAIDAGVEVQASVKHILERFGSPAGNQAPSNPAINNLYRGH
jgi:phospholipase C